MLTLNLIEVIILIADMDVFETPEENTYEQIS
jgi:hypothetical protein